MTETAVRYDAFVSYSHADAALARTVRDGIPRVAKPWFRRRALVVFQDETDLAANPDLWEAVAAALDTSRWLVVVATAAAAVSSWVDREIARFIERHGAGRVILVVVEGHPRWDEIEGRWTNDVLAVPPALRSVTASPVVVDAVAFREAAPARRIDVPVLNVLYEIAAPIFGHAPEAVRVLDVGHRH